MSEQEQSLLRKIAEDEKNYDKRLDDKIISIPLGIVIARAFNGTVLPLVTGFAICGLAVLFSIIWAEKTSLSFYRF